MAGAGTRASGKSIEASTCARAGITITPETVAKATTPLTIAS
jgi:hypothetical protein